MEPICDSDCESEISEYEGIFTLLKTNLLMMKIFHRKMKVMMIMFSIKITKIISRNSCFINMDAQDAQKEKNTVKFVKDTHRSSFAKHLKEKTHVGN